MTTTDDFSQLQDDFLRFTAKIVLCTVTTVSPEGRPRSRMLHPVFTVRARSPVGWVCTSRTPVKARHLRLNPYVAVSYWSPDNDTVYAECRATWVDSEGEKDDVWDLFTTTPPPLGYDLSGYGTPRNRHSARCGSTPTGCRSSRAGSTRSVTWSDGSGGAVRETESAFAGGH